jgi:hypothetical protein
MSTRTSMLALAAMAAVTMSTLVPGNASAFGHGSRATAPTHVITSTPAPSYRSGWGYGRGWCYWHPYSCYRF